MCGTGRLQAAPLLPQGHSSPVVSLMLLEVMLLESHHLRVLTCLCRMQSLDSGWCVLPIMACSVAVRVTAGLPFMCSSLAKQAQHLPLSFVNA